MPFADITFDRSRELL